MCALVVSAPVISQNWVSWFNANSGRDEKCAEWWRDFDKRGILL
jgi:hypothetical protein